jgi:Fur family transcriptional regulator, ferric uptake regulator
LNLQLTREAIVAAHAKESVVHDAPWAKGILKQSGLRSTAARVGVLRHLADHGKPVSHGEVVDSLSECGFDQSTIYRVLQELAEAGLLSKLDLGDQIRRFEYRENANRNRRRFPS